MPLGQIVACALVGREDVVLVVRRSGGGWALPGAQVEPGEWIEDALDRGVREVLGAGVRSASFLCLIEDPDGLFVAFDVTLEAEDDVSLGESQPELTWVDFGRLASLELRPAVLRTALPVGEPPAWLPWRAR